MLVDRLWPRGLAKADAPFDEWLRDIGPSADLRKWYGHCPERFEEFALRYRRELDAPLSREELDRLRLWARKEDVMLLTAARDVEHSGAAVLKDVLSAGGSASTTRATHYPRSPATP